MRVYGIVESAFFCYNNSTADEIKNSFFLLRFGVVFHGSATEQRQKDEKVPLKSIIQGEEQR